MQQQLTSGCLCGMVRPPMGLFIDCQRGGSDLVGVELRGTGWALLVVAETLWAYCGRCGCVAPSCDTVAVEHPGLAWQVALQHGWVMRELVAFSSRYGDVRS